jgi:lipid-A-disaccharide synthase
VGHPLAALPLPETSREAYAAEYGLDPAKQWIALLPGSRYSEVSNNLWGMTDAASEIGDGYEFIVPVAPTITERQLKAIQYDTGDLYLGKDNPSGVTFVRDARAALYHSRAAIVASGTATVQALTIGNPFVVVYRVSRLTFALAKRLVRYPAEIAAQPDADGNLPIAMPNLVAGRRIVPEFLNERFTAANLAAALRPLLEDSPERARMEAVSAGRNGHRGRSDPESHRASRGRG